MNALLDIAKGVFFILCYCKDRIGQRTNMQRLVRISLLLLAILLCVIAFFGNYAVNIFLRFFPLDNPEAVVFTMTHNVGGTQNIILILLEPCVWKTVENSAFTLSLIALASLSLSLYYGKKRHFLDYTLRKLFRNAYIPFLVGCFLVNMALLGLVIYKIPIISYIKTYGVLWDESPQYNALYEEDYVYPDSVKISFDKRKNLMLIILESMEYNFQNAENGGNLPQNQIPEITDLMKKYVSFEPGGITVKGTGWTMGETVAKTCALPLKMPLEGNSSGIRKYLDNAVCLTDILQREGYDIRLIQGTDARFASMNYFVTSHGVNKEKIFDLQSFKKQGVDVYDTSFFLSAKDKDLYEEVKEELLNKKNNLKEPWAILLYTMDTHSPYGRLDSDCADVPKNLQVEKQYPYVLKCASKRLAFFLECAKEQEWYEKTTIAVMGDHPAMIAPEVIGYSEKNIERYWLNFFVNSSVQTEEKRREFTSFDMFPTILEAMGAKIEGRALGLGRSLFSDKPTLVEVYGKDSLNHLLGMKSSLYDAFWK